MTDLPTRETLRFLERVLPAPQARVLGVGSGDDGVAPALAERGYAVTALDDTEFLHFEPDDRYDVVLFTRSLHHIQPVERALDRACAALLPGGLVVAEELAFDRVNVHTARWLYDLESVLVAAEVVAPPDPRYAAERRPLARWRLEHAMEPPLASGHDLLASARERLELSAVEEAPYLYRYLAERAVSEAKAQQVLQAVLDLECRLIRERDIAAAGLRFVGRHSG